MFFFVILALAEIAWGGQDFQVVTDFDDTVKVTHVQNKRQALCNTLLSRKTFLGAAQLLNEFKSVGAPISIVSGGVIHLKALMYDDLKKAALKSDRIYMRHFLAESTLDYKYGKLVELLQHFELPMVLIGDDTQVDPDAYARFAREYPLYVKAVYIHRVTGRPLPRIARPYHTPFEIAVYEHLDGRLPRKSLEAIGELILQTQNSSDLFPDFVRCPDDISKMMDVRIASYHKSDLFTYVMRVTDHIVTLCQKRNH
jgi:hypothetical protein